ncbi:MAG: hypothetical protein IKZ43_01205 [Acidaminococcaceae bacterium]|nr:hypothetical protein [Acidaminococcaceae bacterium]
MSLKKIYQLRRYIAAQAFLQWIVVNVIATVAGKPVWSYPISSFLDVLFCAIVGYLIYLYHNDNLKFDVIVDDECVIESRYIYYQCVILGGLWMFVLLLYCYYTKQSSIKYIFISLFLAAPLFWLKLYYHLVVFVWSYIFRLIFEISSIHKMYKDNEKGQLSVMSALMRFEFMQAVDECFDVDFDLGITDEDLKSVGSKFSKRVDTHGHTQEFVEELKAKNSKTEKGAFIIRVVIPVLFLLFGIFNTLHGGVAGAVNTIFEGRDIARYENNVQAVDITTKRNNIDWKDLTGDKIIFYDDTTLALDKTNGVIYGLFRYSKKKGDTVYYHWLYLKYPEKKALMVYCNDDGIALKDSPANYFDSFGEKRNLITLYYDYLANKMKINKDAETNSKIDLREYHQLKFEKKLIPVKQNTTTSNKMKNGSSDGIVLKAGTGNTQRLEKGDEAVVARGKEITIFRGPELKNRDIIIIPDSVDLSKCVVTVLNSRIVGQNSEAKIVVNMETKHINDKTNQTEIISVPKGTIIKVGIKDASNDSYYCTFTINGKDYAIFIREDYIEPLKNDYWYYTTAVHYPSDTSYKADGWIEGKYLTPIVKRPEKKAESNNNNAGNIE